MQAYNNQCPVRKTHMIRNSDLIPGSFFKSVVNAGGRKRKWQCCLVMIMESKGKFCYPELASPVLLLLQLLESPLPLLCRKPGACTPTDTARAQESTVPLKLLYLSRLLKLPVTCDGCCCSTTAVPLLHNQQS